MAKRKGRDWSEWKKQMTGMHRLDNGFNQRHVGTRLQTTQTSISLRDLDLDEPESAQPRVWVWVLVFLGMLLVRKGYFEFTKHEKIRSQTNISRGK